MPDHRSTRVALAQALLVTVLWSSSWLLIRFGLDDEGLEPVTFAGLRYVTAALVLLGAVGAGPARRAAIRRIDRSTARRLVLLGVIFYAVTQGAQFVAIDHQPAATTSLLLSFTPLIVAAGSGIALAEPPTARQVGGAIAVAVGAVAYFGDALAATTIGMIAALCGLAGNAAGSLLGRRVNRDDTLPSSVITALSMTVGAVILLGVGLAVEGVPSLSVRAWAIVGWLAVVNTAVANTLWNRSLRHLTAVQSAAVNNTMLIQIAVLAWVFLDEALGPLQVAGIVCVSAGVAVVQLAGSRRPVAPAPGRSGPQRSFDPDTTK
ncbi:MAG: DMT family transporter [Actinomycetota bacterium]|nr:DMT family transporter [Actinomycetota bacterium]